MIEFLAVTITLGMVAMGIGACIAVVYWSIKWFVLGLQETWYEWRCLQGFTRIEFIEEAVDEITETRSKRQKETKLYTYGVRAGCVSLLIFIPLHLFVTPTALIVLRHRRRKLLVRMQKMNATQQTLIAPEYWDWLKT